MMNDTISRKEDARGGITLVLIIAGITVLLLHFYYYCHEAFAQWHLTSKQGDGFLDKITRTGLFHDINRSKWIALAVLLVSLLNQGGQQRRNPGWLPALVYLLYGLCFYFNSEWLLRLNGGAITGEKAVSYIFLTLLGVLLILMGGNSVVGMIAFNQNNAVFNTQNETFPQEERLIENEYSINLPARYNLRGTTRHSWINIINPFRGLLIMGSPGSGKSYFIIEHIIRQHIQKGFVMLLYDFKFDDLTKIAYNQYLEYKHQYPVEPAFYVINFDDLSRSHRCNPLDVASMQDITDTTESARIILLGLNPDWIKKQGDFWVESSINFLTAVIWYLRLYENGKYCTLGHVIELVQTEYDKLFSILRTQPQIEALINPFVTAYLNNATAQLEGQIAGATISLGKLSSPNLYYILSGNDFTLDINNPDNPKIVCMGNNPLKATIYGTVLSLYITALTRQLNKKGKHKSSLIFDEFPTLQFNNIDNLLATARSNRVATTLAIQDSSQLKLRYGRDQAEVIMNIAGNIISGQVSGETARHLADRFGKILQDRESVAINSRDTSISRSEHLDMAIPQSTIASLSSGEFVGVVADDPSQKIKLKAFHAAIVNDHKALAKEQAALKELPQVAQVDENMVLKNYLRIKKEVQGIIDTELEKMLNTPELQDRVVSKRSKISS